MVIRNKNVRGGSLLEVKKSEAKAAAMSHHHQMRSAAYMRHFSIIVFHYWSTFVLKDGDILSFKKKNNVINIKKNHFQNPDYSLVMQDVE